MALNTYRCSSRTGGGAGALDSIDGANLLDLYSAIVFEADTFYFYILDDDAAGAESSPDKITPDSNAGNKRWILVSIWVKDITLANTGLHILDTDASHDLIIKPGSDLTADRILTITTGDAARTITLGRNFDTENQVVGTTITIPNTGLHLLDTNASHDLIVKPGSDLTADRTLTITTGDANRTLTLGANSSISGTAIIESLLTTEGDIVTRGAAAAERLAAVAVGQVFKSAGTTTKPAWGVPSIGDMNISSGTLSRSTAGAGAVSGLGFAPKLVFFLCTDNTSTNGNISIGIDNGTHRIMVAMTADGSGSNGSVSESIRIQRGTANYLHGYITTMGADGFTVTYTLTGACAIEVYWFAIG